MDGIWVGRYADEVPPGEMVELTPTNGARILLRFKDDFPTQEVLGPMIVNRPEKEFASESCDAEIPTDLSSLDPTEAVICEPHRAVICLGPIRYTFNERFPILSAAASKPQLESFRPLADRTAFDRPLLEAVATSYSAWPTSGLSPPLTVGECGHSERKMSSGPWQ